MKVAGYCKECLVLVGYEELDAPCSRCGTMLKENDLVKDRVVAKQSRRQYKQGNITFVKGMDMKKLIEHGN